MLSLPYPLLDKLKYLTTSVLARFLGYPVGKRLRGPGQMEPAAIESIFYGFLSWNPGASRGREREGTTASIEKEQKLSKKKEFEGTIDPERAASCHIRRTDRRKIYV